MISMRKINSNIKKNIIMIVSFLILLQPIIDLIIGISIKINFLPSIMSFIRIIVFMFLLYYFIFINKSKSKKKIALFLCFILAYLMCYFINMNFSFEELKSAIRVFYFPALFIIFFSIFEEEKRFVGQKYLLISLGIYAFIIILGFITNTAFNSYGVAKVGTSGYFYAANEIGGIISILLPFVFTYVFNKINIKKVIYFVMILSAIFIMGTKTPFISLVICIVYYIIKLINRKNILKICFISFVSIIALSIFITKTPIYKNIMIHANFLGLSNIKEVIERPDLLDHFLLGSRLKFLNNNTQIYWASSLNNKLLGIGYVNNSKLVEMDFYDIFYRQGIIGFSLYFTIILSMLLSAKRKYDKGYALPIVLIVLISTIVGHVITAPAVSTFVSHILCVFKKEKRL